MSTSTYDAMRSFNQYLDNNFGTGKDSRLRLKAHDTQDIGSDMVSVHFYDQRYREVHGRQVGGSQGRLADLYCQIDCWSAPNSKGQSREGENRKLKDEIETVLKSKVRVPLLYYDGTGGTTQVGGLYVREESAQWLPDPDMKAWSRWSLTYKLKARETE